jgi:hypothetical protein
MTDPSGGLGKAPLAQTSLTLGIVSISLVFGIGLCAVVAAKQGWIQWVATPLYVCGASSAFLGVLAALLGIGGVLGRGSRWVAGVGLLLGSGGVCLFLVILRSVAGG